ncbi:MotA/TolQ/ExbB proton channel family protein [bacterium]|nr:MotA/TolQ/ExbB proton channel family protein [bacterium]
MNKWGRTILSLILVLMVGFALIGPQRGQAAEPDAAVAPAGAPDAEAPEEAPAEADAPEEDDDAPKTKAKTSVLDTIGKGGTIGYIIIFLSFVALSLIIEHAVSIRRDKLCPPELANELEEYFNEEQYEEALELCNVEHNMLTDVVRAGLSRIDAGYERMQEAMQEAGAEAAVGLQQKISYLSLIGNISPMLGLLGTVAGMVGAFGTIATMTVVKPAVLAADINTALVTTLLGLTVAIPVMCAYQFFTNRVTRIILEASTIVSDLMERFKPAK